MGLSKLDILRLHNMLPEKVYYDPFDRSYFRSTNDSKVIPNNCESIEKAILNGINPDRIITITNCTSIQDSIL